MPSAKSKILKSGERVWYAKYKGTDGRWHEEGPACRTQREAEHMAGRRERDAEHGMGVAASDAKITFARFVELRYWPTTVHLSPTTRATYRYYLDGLFLPRFGHLPLRRVTAPVVQQWVNEAWQGGLTARSVAKYHSTLRTILAMAVRDGRLPKNPCESTTLPRIVTPERRALTPLEFENLLAAMPPAHRTLVTTAMETGCRWGELMALRPCDVDWDTQEILIHRVILELSKKNSPTGERFVVKNGPKEGEWRRIQVTPALLLILREHMLAQGLRDVDFLFGTERRTPMSRNTFRTRVWQPARVAAGFPADVTPHLLRHSHASWLLAGGADLVVVMKRLGHRQIQTTQGYLHSMPHAGDRALAALARFKEDQAGPGTSRRTSRLPRA